MANEALVAHVDKISLGIGGVLLVGMIALSFGGGNDKKIDTLSANIDKIEKQLEVVDGRLPEGKLTSPTPSDTFRSKLATSFPTFKFPSWATHRRPMILRDVEKKRDEIVCEHEKPRLLDPEVERGSIKLSWQESDDNRYVRIESYSVFRGRNLDDPRSQRDDFSKVADVPGGEFEVTWEDTDIEPDNSYAYYIISHAAPDDRATQSENYAFEEEQYNLASIVTDNVTTPTDKLIWLHRVYGEDPEFPDPIMDKIEMYVSIWDEDEGAFSKGKRFRNLMVGDDPEAEPVFVGEDEYKTTWYLFELGADQDGEDMVGNPLYKYWVVIKDALSGRTRRLKQGVEPDELQD